MNADFPLLNEPNVMLVALKSAAGGPADWRDCLAHLEDSLKLAGIALPESERSALGRRIEVIFRCLHVVRLVDRDESGKFVITPRGASTLKAHPMGIDNSVLAQFPEFQEFIHRQGSPSGATRKAEHPKEYSEGYMAGLTGDAITDNPYSVEASTHLEWENGWCEARDQKTDVVPPRLPAYTADGTTDDVDN